MINFKTKNVSKMKYFDFGAFQKIYHSTKSAFTCFLGHFILFRVPIRILKTNLSVIASPWLYSIFFAAFEIIKKYRIRFIFSQNNNFIRVIYYKYHHLLLRFELAVNSCCEPMLWICISKVHARYFKIKKVFNRTESITLVCTKNIQINWYRAFVEYSKLTKFMKFVISIKAWIFDFRIKFATNSG